jgi:hypothetical protein
MTDKLVCKYRIEYKILNTHHDIQLAGIQQTNVCHLQLLLVHQPGLLEQLQVLPQQYTGHTHVLLC